MKEIIENSESILTLVISIIALLISVIALYFTFQSYILKSGQKLRCDISTCSSLSCSDSYVSTITLENIKDRATVIFAIYLKLGRGNYLLLEDFENKPLILKPFEVYYKKFDPLLFYTVSLKKVDIKKVLNNQKIKRRVLLSTTDGKYIVKANTKHWRPISIFFKNYYTAIIHPVRIPYKNKYYGDRIKFLVEFKAKDKKETIIDLYNGEDKLSRFKNIHLTKESLENKKNLKEFFKQQRKKGNIDFNKIKVIDFQKMVEEIKNDYDEKEIEIENHNFLNYNILGWIYTRFDNIKMKIKNKKTAHNNS